QRRLVLVQIRRPQHAIVFAYTTLFRSIRAGFFWWVRGYVSGNLINFAPARQKLCDLIVDLVTDALTGSDAEVFDNFNIASRQRIDRKSTRLNSSHVKISYAVFCLQKKT